MKAMTPRTAPWIVRSKPNPSASLRLFCFPYAGAGALVYRTWAAEFDPSVEVLGIQPPGREGRFTEPLLTRIEPLLDGLFPAILPLLDRPFAFFGHSLGSLVSFELCRRLRAAGRPLPEHLFVSGRRAVHQAPREEPLHTLPDAGLIEEVRRYNGTPAEVLADKELLGIMLPILRADFAVHETYAYADEPPLDVPITAFGGIDDPTVPEDGLDAWRHQTRKGFRRLMFPGDHFYLNKARAALTRAIAEDLRGASGRPTPA
jgi:medium-chain acyl-[acyl-carrier-protein] hydrolase